MARSEQAGPHNTRTVAQIARILETGRRGPQARKLIADITGTDPATVKAILALPGFARLLRQAGQHTGGATPDNADDNSRYAATYLVKALQRATKTRMVWRRKNATSRHTSSRNADATPHGGQRTGPPTPTAPLPSDGMQFLGPTPAQNALSRMGITSTPGKAPSSGGQERYICGVGARQVHHSTT